MSSAAALILPDQIVYWAEDEDLIIIGRLSIELIQVSAEPTPRNALEHRCTHIETSQSEWIVLL